MSGQLLTVHNKFAGPAVYTDESSQDKAVPYTWEGNGHIDPQTGGPSYLDYQDVPDSMINQPNFRNAVKRNLFEVVDEDSDPRYGTGPAWHHDAGRVYTEDKHGNLNSGNVIIERSIERIDSSRSLNVLACVGPGQNVQGDSVANFDICGAAVVETDENTPPLCATHKALARQYHRVVANNGKPAWIRES